MNRALTLAEAMDKLVDTPNPNENVADRWANLFGVAKESPEYFAAMGAIYRSFFELRNEVEEAEIRDKAKELYRNAAASLAQFVNPAQCGRFTVSNAQQHKEQINIIHLAADTLPERLIPDVQQPVFDELDGQLTAILEEAAKLDNDPATARLVKDSISTLSMVLRCYKMLGPDGAARIYGSVMAELLRSFGEVPPEKPKSKSLLHKALAAGKMAGYAVIFAGGVVHGADQLLTDSPEVAAIVMGETPADATSEVAAPETPEVSRQTASEGAPEKSDLV